MRQTSLPERTRSLPNRDLNLRYEYFRVSAARDLRLVRYFEEQRERFHEIGSSFLNRGALTGDVEFRTRSDEAVVFPLNDCC